MRTEHPPQQAWRMDNIEGSIQTAMDDLLPKQHNVHLLWDPITFEPMTRFRKGLAQFDAGPFCALCDLLRTLKWAISNGLSESP